MAWKIVIALLSVAYPALVFCGLCFWHLSPRTLSLLLVAAGLFLFVSRTQGEPAQRKNRNSVVLFLAMLALVGTVWVTDNALALKFYPVLVSFTVFASFAYTLRFPPTMIFRFALLGDKSVGSGPSRASVERYCRRVTVVWCAFLVFNASAALFTALACPDWVWSVYNGLVSYILMGVLFAGEFLMRRKMQAKQNGYTPVSRQKNDFRSADSVVCFSGKAGEGDVRTWADFVRDVGAVRHFVRSKNYERWILHSEDSYYFAVSLLAVLQCKKETLITANVQPAFIAEMQCAGTGFLGDENAADEFRIADILTPADAAVDDDWPEIDPAKALMTMYTSGTTGTPKRVPKILLQFENETRELVHLWGGSYANKYFCSTVNHHHIYGLLLSVLVPLTFSVPFRRVRIDFPNELADFRDAPYAIIASPAFLKRLLESGLPDDYFKIKPFIHSSGGVLPVEAAEKTFRITGFWPMEIYGSTETGGIAYRQSKDGMDWTPFAGCKMTLSPEGCLNVRSSYILESEGFTTGDLVEFGTDGKFLLKGRADSIVKIEEKRISLPEVEKRLAGSGLVKDSCAVALSRKRQFLAVAIVLNDAGKEKFRGARKLEMNNFFRDYLSQFLENTVLPKKWRFVDSIPVNTEGKRLRDEVEKLFDAPEDRVDVLSAEVTAPATLSMRVRFPETSVFFDGHFPEFHLLPAVAQVDFAMHWARQYLGTSLKLAKIPRIKFTRPILPEKIILAELSYAAGTSRLTFRYTEEETGAVCASGSIVVEKADAE